MNFAEGNRLEVDIESGMVKIEKTGKRLQGERKPEFLLEILRKGGLLEHLRQTVLAGDEANDGSI